jgi:hypothetical protein
MSVQPGTWARCLRPLRPASDTDIAPHRGGFERIHDLTETP